MQQRRRRLRAPGPEFDCDVARQIGDGPAALRCATPPEASLALRFHMPRFVSSRAGAGARVRLPSFSLSLFASGALALIDVRCAIAGEGAASAARARLRGRTQRPQDYRLQATDYR